MNRVLNWSLLGVLLVISALIWAATSLGGPNTDCMWPDRPNCMPVGDVRTETRDREENDGDNWVCVETRYYDDIGEAAFREFSCP